MSLDPAESDQADLASRFYPIARDYVLEKRDWTFATERLTLGSPTTAGPDWGYVYEHTIPGNVLRVMMVTDSPEHLINGGDRFDYRREGNTITSDAAAIYLKVIIQQTDTSRFSASFVVALGYYLATLMCIPLVESKTLRDQLMLDYEKAEDKAAALDGGQGKSDKIRNTALTRVRFQRTTRSARG